MTWYDLCFSRMAPAPVGSVWPHGFADPGHCHSTAIRIIIAGTICWTLGSQEPKLGHFLKKSWSVSVLRAFRMRIPIVRWVPGLWGHFTAHEILQPWSTTCCPSPPVQAASPSSPVYLQNASWAVRNLGVVHWGLTQTPKSSRNSELATCAFGSWCPVPSSGSRGHTGGWARDRSPHHHTPAQGGGRALTGGCISVTTLNIRRLLLPFTWLNLFKLIYIFVKES